MRKYHIIIIIVALVSLVLIANAEAGKGNLCNKDGWTTAQSGAGASFQSMKECVKAHEVFQPALEVSPQAVGAEQFFDLTATGFHQAAGVTLTFAVTGQPPYFSYPGGTNGEGVFVLYTFFQSCGNASPYDLTLTVTDSSGVHASTSMTLC